MMISNTNDLRFSEHPFGFVIVAVLGADGKRRVMGRAKSYKAAKAKLDWYDKNRPDHGVTIHPLEASATVSLGMEWVETGREYPCPR